MWRYKPDSLDDIEAVAFYRDTAGEWAIQVGRIDKAYHPDNRYRKVTFPQVFLGHGANPGD
jgi:hypothetical protein